MKIRFGETQIEIENSMTVYDAAAQAGLISREVIAASVNGNVVALTAALTDDADVRLLTFADEEGKHVFWHSASHVLAQAVKRLYPTTKLTIGPAVANGFYYDFDSEISFTPEILAAIEAEMKKIVKENHKIERFELPREEAIAFMTITFSSTFFRALPLLREHRYRARSLPSQPPAPRSPVPQGQPP